MSQNEPFYITTPIYYPSGNPHIGHCYTTLACDVVARMKRMQGYDVMFLTGTDEHGQKIEKKALELNTTPKEYVDEIVDNFKKLWSTLGISYDRFVRTTDSYHIETVQNIFKKLYDDGYIYRSSYKGKYCTPCESFWTESQLVDGKCPDCGRDVSEEEEEAYFFKLSQFGLKLKELLLDEERCFLEPKSRVNEMIHNFIDPGLQDLCVSRTSFKWGIPVSFDDKHIVYVWIDALTNYISAMGYMNNEYDDFDKYWPADMHVMAKEIVRFHSLIWPSIIMALGLELPKKVYGHGWITFGNSSEKMSKSKGNVVDPFILSERYGVDSLRYEILREMPFGSDAPYSTELMFNRINTDLANDYGNLISRTVSMVDKYFGGELPISKDFTDADEELLSMIDELPNVVSEGFSTLHISETLAKIFAVISRANKYIDENEPWKLGKDETKKDRLSAVLYNLLETIRRTSILLSPVMPHKVPEVYKQIGACEKCTTWDMASVRNGLPQDVKVYKGEVLFPRIDIAAELEALENLSKPDRVLPEEPLKDLTCYDNFAKLDIRAVKVISCENVKKSKKLLKFIVDDGFGERQVLSGIAEFYTPEELIGKTLAMIVNLEPRKMMGELSNGMILSVRDGDRFRVIEFPDEIKAGADIS